MDERSSRKPPAQSGKKLLLIPVLGVVLLYLVFAPSDDGEAPALVAPPPAANPGASDEASPSSKGSRTRSGPAANAIAVSWPTTPLADVLAVNPFKLPEELKPLVEPVEEDPPPPPAAVAAPEEVAAAKAAELREAMTGLRLGALIRTPSGIGAMVGGTVVLVGDTVGNRFRVIAIRPEGVELELIDKPAPVDGSNQP